MSTEAAEFYRRHEAEFWRRRARIAGRLALAGFVLSVIAVVLSTGCLLDWWGS